MKKLLCFLFPTSPTDTKSSCLLLAARIIFGALLITHGIGKLNNYAELSTTFADPLGVGSNLSVILAIFAEVLCSLAFIVGFLYRLALIPMAFTMIIATFVIHGGDSFSDMELSLVYLLVFILMYIAGPGIFAIDRFFAKKFCCNR